MYPTWPASLPEHMTARSVNGRGKYHPVPGRQTLTNCVNEARPTLQYIKVGVCLPARVQPARRLSCALPAASQEITGARCINDGSVCCSCWLCLLADACPEKILINGGTNILSA